jgi:hypothetical protein
MADLDRELLERFLIAETNNLKELRAIRDVLEKSLMHLVELNASTRRLVQVSGGSPATTKQEMVTEIAAHEDWNKELKERLTKVALENKGGDSK